MNKRVLRDRSTLRRPPDEPPIKRVPPPSPKPKRIIKGPFPFEDLPPEFYNSILEKMKPKAFKQFNFGSKFSARICEEFEMKDGPFYLEELPLDLYSTIVEKLRFKDLTIFNLGSRLTVEMCEQLREIEVQSCRVSISEYYEYFERTNRWKNLDLIPQNVRIFTKRLEIQKKDLTAIVKHRIRAYMVEFYHHTGTDPEFIKEVLELTRPTQVYFDSASPEILKLAELKKMDVVFRPWNNFDDRDLLAIDLESFTVDWLRNARSITSEGILRLLQEWKAGTRRIKNIRIMFEGLDRKLIRMEFPGHPQPTSGRMMLCKEDGENDCFLVNNAHSVDLFEKKCRGVGKQYKNGRCLSN